MSTKFYLINILIFSAKFSDVQSVKCTFELNSLEVYSCSIDEQTVLSEEDLLPITGNHLLGYDNSNVTFLKSTRNAGMQIFPSLVIDEFENLESVYISSGVRIFKSHISNCNNLEDLALLIIRNEISSLPGGIFRNCKILQNLDLIMSISSIDENAFEGLTGLKQLTLSINQIKSLAPRTFANLHSLTQLSIDNNQLEGITSGIFDSLTILETLDLRQNNITSWDPSILENNLKLQTLDLSGNLIQIIDGNTFANLQNLRLLSVGSLIEEIPTFLNLVQLEELNLNSNRIKEVSADSFKSLVSLKVLRLSFNEIELVNFTMRPEKILSQLENLTLSGNNLTNLQDNAFSMLENMNMLQLAFNQIERLNENTIRPITQLRYLDIRSNRVRKIEQKLFDGVSVLEFLGNNNICFNGNFTINNTLNNDDFETRIISLMERCFNFASTSRVNLLAVILSIIVTMLFKI